MAQRRSQRKPKPAKVADRVSVWLSRDHGLDLQQPHSCAQNGMFPALSSWFDLLRFGVEWGHQLDRLRYFPLLYKGAHK